jgi:DNA (cytosine-5)-methyltransferase 1
MRHLGDITKISGYTAPVVDCIIGGSPCQDLSVAGKRAGLDGERSGLYIEQVRIVKEMRERDERNGKSGVDIRPRYMVWENVPGAFSSNKGEDFRIVLEELAKVKEPNAVIPMPDKGKWANSGCIVGDGWSIAWRVLDAQFWGVPQRRRRIALVADFGGQSAPEILFVSQSLSGDIEPSEPKRKATSPDASRGIGADDRKGGIPYTLKIRSGVSVDSYGKAAGKGALIQDNLSATLGVSQDQYLFQPIGVDIYNTALTGDKVVPLTSGGITSTGTCPKVMTPITFEPGIASREGGHIYEGVSGTLRANAGDNQMATAYSVENHPNDSRVGINEDGIVQALTSRMGTGGGNVPMVMQCYSKSKRAQSALDNESWVESETANTLNAFDVGDVRTTEAVVYALDRASFNQGKNGHGFEISDTGVNSPLLARGPSAVAYVDTSHADDVVRLDDIVAPLQARDFKGGKAICYRDARLMEAYQHQSYRESDVCGTLTAGQNNGVRGDTPLLCYSVDQGGGKSSVDVREDKAPTLTTTHDGAPAVCYGWYPQMKAESITWTEDKATCLVNGTNPGFHNGVCVAVDCRNATEDTVNGALQSNAAHSLNGNNVVRTRYIVRRLTPLECERLQGYPDGWTDIGEWTDSNGKKRQTSDAARYKALGNSIALPPWKWVLKRICACYERDATMASLFDGIGGFPYLWEQLNGKGTCLWASEIEEFPMAVTKVRIGGNT